MEFLQGQGKILRQAQRSLKIRYGFVARFRKVVRVPRHAKGGLVTNNLPNTLENQQRTVRCQALQKGRGRTLALSGESPLQHPQRLGLAEVGRQKGHLRPPEETPRRVCALLRRAVSRPRRTLRLPLAPLLSRATGSLNRANQKPKQQGQVLPI